MKFSNNNITNHTGSILAMLRSGKDESTLGPWVEIANNKFTNIKADSKPLLLLSGIQKTFIEKNSEKLDHLINPATKNNLK
jgi:uncharacterized protein with NAD-binding domain and iron-sulfur cluster